MITRFQWLAGSLGLLAAGGGLLWWMLDHRRGTAWAVKVVNDRFPDVGHLSAQALAQEMRSTPVPVLLDARSKEEYELSHLPDAVHLPLDTVTEKNLSQMDSQVRYVVYCAAGYRACQLARRLKAAGVSDVRNLEGGIFAWANAGFPTERQGSPVPEVHPYRSLFIRMLKPGRRPK